VQHYSNLLVWRKAHALAVSIHELTERYARRDRSGAIGQVRRSALSIPSNIAEGCGRRTNREFARFLHIAVGSTSEVEYQLEYMAAIKLLPVSDSDSLRERVREIRRMLYGLLKKL
jgi:four helix bundle protein